MFNFTKHKNVYYLNYVTYLVWNDFRVYSETLARKTKRVFNFV